MQKMTYAEKHHVCELPFDDMPLDIVENGHRFPVGSFSGVASVYYDPIVDEVAVYKMSLETHEREPRFVWATPYSFGHYGALFAMIATAVLRRYDDDIRAHFPVEMPLGPSQQERL